MEISGDKNFDNQAGIIGFSGYGLLLLQKIINRNRFIIDYYFDFL